MTAKLAVTVALSALWACAASSTPRARPMGIPGWPTSAEAPACPCTDPANCRPVNPRPEGTEEVYAFHTAGAADWRQYDWAQISTVSVFGALDPDLLCHAHAHGGDHAHARHGFPHAHLAHYAHARARARARPHAQQQQQQQAHGVLLPPNLCRQRQEHVHAAHLAPHLRGAHRA